MQTMKIQQASVVNATANTVKKVMSEYIDIKTSFGIIKQEWTRSLLNYWAVQIGHLWNYLKYTQWSNNDHSNWV